ncbi:MAG: ABC transporter ATP-binding protein, partial [Acidobacteriia bacterium]|nr:ABC transporter ATP-binding protein [Terriglobia bacterium]
MKQHDSFWSAWNERVSALRNVPPVLKIVWQYGPTVVALGLVCRVLVSLLPLAMLALTKLIVDYIVHAVGLHQAVPRQFWWLVAAEFGLAVLTSLLGRVVDYFDAVLADKYSQHVSVQVMEHAANLDLLAYENPVFYDRLERARVQATDRLAMIQAIGRLVQQVVTS